MSVRDKGGAAKLAQSVSLMDPKVDFVFKSLFGDEKHPRILISFLNAVFGYSEKDGTHQHITKIKIENPHLDKTMVDDKYSVLDIRATLNTEEIVNIEIQIKSPGSMTNRLLYYLSKMLGNQLCEGESYSKLKRCVSIGVLNFDLIKNQNFHNKFNFRSDTDKHVLSELLELHTIELPKLAKQKKLDTSNLLVDWALFLSDPEGKNTEKLQKQVPEIKEAMGVLEMLSHDKHARAIYEKRQQALHDKASALQHEREEGKHEGRQEGAHETQQKIAKKLLQAGVDHAVITTATGLTAEQIQNLQKHIAH